MTDYQFEKAVETYGDTIFRVAYSYLKNRSDAEDVMQETLLKLYQEVGRFESEEHRKRWLIRVAVNQCKSTLRSTWLRRTVPLEELREEPAVPGPQVDDTLWRAIQRLPREQREAVVLFYYEDLTTEEIARVTGASPGAVRTRLSRARDHLRSLLEVEWDG